MRHYAAKMKGENTYHVVRVIEDWSFGGTILEQSREALPQRFTTHAAACRVAAKLDGRRKLSGLYPHTQFSPWAGE